jgi:hypothetical protein
MTRSRQTLRRLAFSAPLLAGLVLTAPPPSPVFAQEAGAEAGVEGEASAGEPLYGYVGTAFLAAAVLFVLCKTARR